MRLYWVRAKYVCNGKEVLLTAYIGYKYFRWVSIGKVMRKI